MSLWGCFPGLLAVACGIAAWFIAHHGTQCEMYFMHPAFIRINMTTPADNNSGVTTQATPFVSKYADKYKLFRYHDGYGPNSNYLGGFPVIFVPGNRGSYQQARSFGSALLFASGKLAVADIFTVDLAEEASAVFGDTLGDQITFLNDVVVTVKSFYAREFGDVNVTLIAHSMGGIVARGVFMLRAYVPGSVANIITLGTPHQRLPLPWDPSLSLLHSAINHYWSLAVEDGPRPGNPSAVTSTVVATPSLSSLDEPPADIVVEMNGTVPKEAGSDVSPSVVHTPADSNSTSNQSSRLHPREILRNVALFSIHGGVRDVQVAPESTSLQGIVKADKKAWLSTVHISSTQCSVDHLAILWCRQFVDDLARVLISISVACGGIEYDEAQYAALPPLKNVSSCTAIGRVKAIHAALTAPVDAVYDTDSEFNPEWYQHVLVAGSSAIFGLPYALSSVLSLVSLLVLAKSSVNQPLPCHSSGCLRSLLHSVAPWNHLPLLLAPVYTLKYPLQGALSWYASAVATAMPGVNLRPYLTVEAFVSRLALFTRWSVGAILSVQLLCLGLKEAKPVLPGVVIVGSESLEGFAVQLQRLLWGMCSVVLSLFRVATPLNFSWLLAAYAVACLTFAGVGALLYSMSKLCGLLLKRKPARSPKPSTTVWIAVAPSAIIFGICSSQGLSSTSILALVIAWLTLAVLVRLLLNIVFPTGKCGGLCIPQVSLTLLLLSSVGPMLAMYRQVYLELLALYTGQSHRQPSFQDSLTFGSSVGSLMPLVVVVWSFPCDDECTGLLSRCQPALVWALRWCSIHGARVLLGLAAVAPPKVFTVKPTGTPQHAACPSCLHEDGGPDAVFEETDPALSVTLSAGVQLGPTFRVVACNCARMCDTVGDMCPFCVCKCRECGGSAQRRPLSTPQYDDDDGDDGTASPNVAISWRRMLSDHSSLMLVCVAAGLALYVLPHPHLLTVTIPAISILFCGALW